MYVRIVHPTIPADKAEAAAKHWATFMGQRAKNNPMLERGFMAATADRSSVVAVTIWKQLPDPEATQTMREEIMAQMQQFASGPMPPMDEYEVLAEIK